jgi:hypothetical protein
MIEITVCGETTMLWDALKRHSKAIGVAFTNAIKAEAPMPTANWSRLKRAERAAADLRVIARYLRPEDAPGLAKKIRSAIKSADGAVRNAQRFQGGGKCQS